MAIVARPSIVLGGYAWVAGRAGMVKTNDSRNSRKGIATLLMFLAR